MNLAQRIEAFSQLGHIINGLTAKEFDALALQAANENPWFTANNVKLALNGIGQFLVKSQLQDWVKPYSFGDSRAVGIVMAGNIPLVGFHDLLCVLMAGHQAHIKLSSHDSVLLKFMIERLTELDSAWKAKIVLADKLKSMDAMIATGSDNTARYFEYYFRQIPHIIRRNRSSCGVIMGEEPESELKELGKDVFSYFGLGCRNVSKLFIPTGYDLRQILKAWESFSDLRHHHKYVNNYDYQKSIMLINQTPFLDNGFVMLTANANLVSPISVVYYEEYDQQNDLKIRIDALKDKLQCIVSARGWFSGSYAFGQAQLPGLTDYADNIDTLKFLEFR